MPIEFAVLFHFIACASWSTPFQASSNFLKSFILSTSVPALPVRLFNLAGGSVFGQQAGEKVCSIFTFLCQC